MKLAKMKAGDAVEHVFKKTGIHQLVKALTKGNCNCDKRKKKLNDWSDRRRK
jgi:hypothetical protein